MNKIILLLVFAVAVISACTVPVQVPPDEIPDTQPEEQPPAAEIIEPPPAPEPPVEVTPEITPQETPEVEIPVEPEQEEVTIDFEYPFFGDMDAPVTVIEYADFASNVDSNAAFVQVGSMKRDFLRGDDVKLVFKPYPVSNRGMLAARASLCMWEQGSKQFWAFHDVLFTFYVRLDEMSIDNYLGRVPNLDRDAFDQCLAEKRYTDIIAQTLDEGNTLGINETPGFIIGDSTYLGNTPYKTLKAAINKEIDSLK